ncbi:MAG TPA: bacteriocin fulvocin C-related protein [Pyrinomonadaceae bacterium]|nr:bacteriocin fulvocin C-related protein [Pyrinomonadaceae bacterium]
MQSLSPHDRSFLWRVHLALYITQRPNLTRDQQNVVLDTLAFASPQLFTAPNPGDAGWRTRVHEQMDQLRRRGLQLFDKEEAAEIFAMVGQRQQEADVLRKYLSLSEFKRTDRKAAFANMSAQDKANLWHVHLALNLAQHSEWNEQQRSIVLETAAMVTAKLYEIPKGPQWTTLVDEPARVLVQKALLVFSRSQAVALFVELGGSEPSAHHKAKPAASPSPCDCSHESDWCVSYDCYSNNCKSSIDGCGFLGFYPCTGLCFKPSTIM